MVMVDEQTAVGLARLDLLLGRAATVLAPQADAVSETTLAAMSAAWVLSGSWPPRSAVEEADLDRMGEVACLSRAVDVAARVEWAALESWDENLVADFRSLLARAASDVGVVADGGWD